MWIAVDKLKAAIATYEPLGVETEEELYKEFQKISDQLQARGKVVGASQKIDASTLVWSAYRSSAGMYVNASVNLVVTDPELDRLWTAKTEAYEKYTARRTNRYSRRGRSGTELRLEIEAIALRLEDHPGKTMSIKSDVAQELGLI